MQDNDSTTQVDQQIRVLSVIRGALLASTVIYFLISYVNIANTTATGTSFLQTFKFILTFVALTSTITGVFVRRFFLSDEKINQKVSSIVSGSKVERGSQIKALVSYWIVWNVLSWALFESVAVFGLVLYVLGGTRTLLAAFCAVSFACMLIMPPPPAKLRSLLGVGML